MSSPLPKSWIGVVLVVLATAGCGGHSKKDAPPETMHFESRPDLTPPVVTVAASKPAQAAGDIFIAPKQNAPEKGPEILDGGGQPIWFGPVGGQATDFREQTYQGQPVLTWWEGPPDAPVDGSGVGHGVIADSSYQEIARVDSTFGPDTVDLHEFLLTPRGTALLLAYRIVPRNLSSIGGPAAGKAVDCVVEEIDVSTGSLVFIWHSLDHVPLSDSYLEVPPKTGKGSMAAYDYFHANSVELEPNGDLLVSARNTHAVYEVGEDSGSIVWQLGGKRSTFAMGKGTGFAWQHDARRQADGTITIFDDEASPAAAKESRAIRIRLDRREKTATLVSSYANGTLSGSQGNAQVLPNGDTFVGWGAVPRLTEFAPDGTVVFDATFSKGDDSYRAYRFPWSGLPTTRPAIAVAESTDDDATVYASWNGATEVKWWRVVGGINSENLKPVGGDVTKQGFETTLEVQTSDPYLAVQALAADGGVLSQSAAVARGGGAMG
jgi:Arylsulfotransferase (ASST)